MTFKGPFHSNHSVIPPPATSSDLKQVLAARGYQGWDKVPFCGGKWLGKWGKV